MCVFFVCENSAAWLHHECEGHLTWSLLLLVWLQRRWERLASSKKKRIQAAFNFKKSLIHVGVATPFSKCHVIRSGCYGAEDLKWYLCTIGLGAELRLDSLRVYRLEKATYNQLSFGVNVGVSHVLFSRETIGSPEWLDPEWAQREMKEQQEGRIIQSVSLNVHSVTKQIVLKGQWMNIHQIFFYCMLWFIYIHIYSSYLTRCLINFSRLLTEDMFLWMTGTFD